MAQDPEQKARERIDRKLKQAGWAVQDGNRIDFSASPGLAVREYQTDVGPADYVLFIDRQPLGIIEAKRQEQGENLTKVEEQSGEYATAKLRWTKGGTPLPFIYESTGIVTRIRDQRDPKLRSREVFTFHRPEALKDLLSRPDTLRARLRAIPALNPHGLRDCQTRAIVKLEASFADTTAPAPSSRWQRERARPTRPSPSSTGCSSTPTPSASCFWWTPANLAEQEFMAYAPNHDNRKLTELYNVQRLQSSFIADSSQVCISTIQRLYSILKGEPLDESAEQDNPAEHRLRKEPLPVVYNPRIPIEHFDFIVIDECHCSIYNRCPPGSAKHEAGSPRIWSPPILQGPVVGVTGTGLLPYIRPVYEEHRSSGLDEIRAYCPLR